MAMLTPTKENAPVRGARKLGTFAAPKGGEAKDTGFPADALGTPILDTAALEVLKAWRYFSTAPGDLPAIVAALLVVAWAVLRGKP